MFEIIIPAMLIEIVMIGFTVSFRRKLWNSNSNYVSIERNDYQIGSFFFSIFWFVYLPILGTIMLMNKILSTKFKLPKLKKKNEIAPGIACPIDVLVSLVKVSLIKNPGERIWSDGPIQNDKVYVSFNSYHEKVVKIRVGDINIEGAALTESQHKELYSLRTLLLKNQEEQDEAQVLAHRRNTALSAIENLLEIEA